MCLPKHVVISRKGFDSGTGHVPSPIMDDGTMISLPIPDAAGTVSYADLAASGHSFGKMVTGLSAKRVGRDRQVRPLRADDRAHLDPDLVHHLRLRRPGWRPCYGQCGKDATILRQHGVGSGDLFLFFGWFRRRETVGDAYRFVPGSPNVHALFGYLRVGEVIHLSHDPVPAWARDHPHLRGAARQADVRNTLFVSADHLGLPGAEDLPGAGAFPRFTEAVQLTAPGMPRSNWCLPNWFFPGPGVPPLSSHEEANRWRLEGDACFLQSAARG